MSRDIKTVCVERQIGPWRYPKKNFPTDKSLDINLNTSRQSSVVIDKNVLFFIFSRSTLPPNQPYAHVSVADPLLELHDSTSAVSSNIVSFFKVYIHRLPQLVSDFDHCKKKKKERTDTQTTDILGSIRINILDDDNNFKVLYIYNVIYLCYALRLSMV